MMEFQRILVGVDDSDLGQAVLERSLALAQACKARLHLFHCLMVEAIAEPIIPPISGGIADLGTYPGLVDNVYLVQQMQEQESQAITLLKKYSDIASQQGVSTEFSHQVGEPGRALCQIAKDWSADLIVIGRRGRSGFAEAFLGSVSNYVVHHAPCSVLVIQEVHPAHEPSPTL
jgi:nucleotide-binding universal stress UspA family protein